MDECFDFMQPITKPTHLEADWKCKPDGVVVLTHISGSGQATFRNRWASPVLINGTSVASNGTLSLNFTEDDNATIVYTASDDDPDAFKNWNASESAIVGSTGTSCRFELTYVDIDKMLLENGELGDYVFYNFSNIGAISSIAQEAIDFSNVKKVGANFCCGMFGHNNDIETIPGLTFYFSNLEEAGDYFMYGIFERCLNLKTIGKNNFSFPSLTTVDGAECLRNAFTACSNLSLIKEGSFQFPVLTILVSLYNNSHFQYCFAGCANLTSLPLGSFNWGRNLTTVSPVGFLNYFCQSSGLTVPGNGMVQIYTPVAVTRFDGSTTSGKGNYTADSTIYINGTTPVTTITNFKTALNSGEAEIKFPVGSEIEDQYDGMDNPLIVVQYLDSSNSASYNGAEGVILMRKYAIALDDLRFSTTTSCNYPDSLVYSQLANSSYLDKCSNEIQNAISEIDIPYFTPTVGIGSLHCNWFLPSGIETGGTDQAGEGIYWEYYKKNSGSSTPTNSAVASRIATTLDGTQVRTWIRTTASTGNPGTPMAIFTTGVENSSGGTNGSYIRPACFVAKETLS